MSFISVTKGKSFDPGYFLVDNENCTRETRQFKADGVTADENGMKLVKGGTAYPSNDSEAIGIVYEDVNVTNGDAAGSVVTKGEVYEDLLAETLDSAAKTTLEGAGFKFTTSPNVTREGV